MSQEFVCQGALENRPRNIIYFFLFQEVQREKERQKDTKVEVRREERWRVLENSQTTLIGVSLKRICEWAGAHNAVGVTAALWQRPGNLCVCVCQCVSASVHRYAQAHGWL